MKYIQVVIVTILLFSCEKKSTTHKITVNTSVEPNTVLNSVFAFQRNDGIYIKPTGKKESLVLNGHDPCLSPNGKILTYTKYGDEKDFNRRVYFFDLKTKREKELNAPGDNFYGAIWSPDGEYVAFMYMGQGDWEIGIIKSNNSGFKTIKGRPTYGLCSPTWAPDSKSIITHDLQELFEFDLNGKEIKRLNIHETFGDELYFSGNSRFWFNKDKNGFFFNSGVHEFMQDVEGPVEAISYYDITTKQSERVSPTGLYADNLFMLTSDRLIFNGSREKQMTSDIYQYSISEKTLDIIIRDGREPSGNRFE